MKQINKIIKMVFGVIIIVVTLGVMIFNLSLGLTVSSSNLSMHSEALTQESGSGFKVLNVTCFYLGTVTGSSGIVIQLFGHKTKCENNGPSATCTATSCK
ncbi:MAG: hypothetical protein LBT27_02700 [Prevotellaceae bacterium]|jgi:hypothetical protein|nr:hypothetical protein [Prevotellaceae bacterium]